VGPGPVIACVRGAGDLAELFRAGARITPRLARQSGALVLDLTGCERLLLNAPAGAHSAIPSERATRLYWTSLAEALSRHLCATWPHLAATLRVGLAPTRTLARLAMELQRDVEAPSWHVVCPCEILTFLHGLPLHLLWEIPDLIEKTDVREASDLLTQCGIVSVGQLAQLAPQALQRRCGRLGATLAALAAGRDVMPLQAEVPEARIGVRIGFTFPPESDHLAYILPALACRLATTLRERCLEAHRVALLLQMNGGPALQTARHLAQGTASPEPLLDHALRLLAVLGSTGQIGDCTAIFLRVTALRPLRIRQTMFCHLGQKHPSQNKGTAVRSLPRHLLFLTTH
jgi:nucleotidyltransferase/DNA polymerase involved in DNA repair